MRISRYLGWGLYLASVLALSGCGSSRSGTNPASTTSAGVAAALTRYFDALRRTDGAGVRAAVAPDYSYDPGSAYFDPRDPFDHFLGLTYTELHENIEALSTVGNTATATVTTTFTGKLTLESRFPDEPRFRGQGQVSVNGTSRLVLEWEQRGPEWKLTAVRPIERITATTLSPLTSLSQFTVNGQTSLEVSPGAPLTLKGVAHTVFRVLGFIRSAFKTETLKNLQQEEWELQLLAPDTPGRYLVYVFSSVFAKDPETGGDRFLRGHLRTVPVTVVRRQ